MILGFDPGRDKCGVAILDGEIAPSEKLSRCTLYYHEVINSQDAIAIIAELMAKFTIDLIVMGNLTTSKSWYERLQSAFDSVRIVMIDERNSTLEARDRYWQMYPPQGLKKLIPQGLRLPPRPIDDIVAILLIERYLAKSRQV